MLCFHVEVNGQKACSAGLDALGSLAVHLTGVHPQAGNAPPPPEQITLTVSAYLQPAATPEWTMARWLNRPLKPGDEIRIRIAEVDTPCDPPLAQIPIGAHLHPNPKQLLRPLEKAYAEMREQIESQSRDGYSI